LFLPRPKPNFRQKTEGGRRTAQPDRAEENQMGSLSWVHWLLVIVVFLLLFGGRGKISELMGDFASGIKAFKKGMSEDDSAKADTKSEGAKTIDHQAAQPAPQPETHKAG
jgi:sec-independent protein translocase protein TatA